MPYTFLDSASPPRTWEIRPSHALCIAVREATGINIYDMPRDKFKGLFQLLATPETLMQVAWIMVRSTKQEPPADQASFDLAIDGPAMERLGECVLQAIPDFFSDAAGRDNLREVIVKAKRLGARVQERATAAVKAFNPDAQDLDKVEAELKAHLEKSNLEAQTSALPAVSATPSQPHATSSSSSGSGPVNAESTPTGTPSGS